MPTQVEIEQLPVPIEIRPMRTARRLRLRFDERRSVLKLTCPPHYSRRKALAWVAEQRPWVDAQLAKASARISFVDRLTIPLEGRDVQLRWVPGASRTPQFDDAQLVAGGTVESFGPRIERFLRKQALEILSAETGEYALKAGATLRGVSVGDADTRWGSCSAQGRIRYSWRLILAPSAARRFVVAHEVAHLTHLNHGPAFKALEAQLFEGDVAAARALLRRVGPSLKRFGGRL